jgi:hypothetical protein
MLDKGIVKEKDVFSEGAKFGPNTVARSAVAEDIDAKRSKPAGDTTLEDGARDHRHTALRNIFVELMSALQRPPVDLMTGSAEDKAIQEVAEAFKNWALTNFANAMKRIIDPNEAKATTAVLKMKMAAFLHAINK